MYGVEGGDGEGQGVVTSNQNQPRLCHTMALPFTLKKYLKAKEESWKLKYFTMQKYNLQKNPLKETKILQDIITNLKFQTQANISSFKNPHIKNRPIIIT